LHFAAKGGDKGIADLLLENQADVDAKANGGYTPLHFAAFGGLDGMAELLLAKNADVNARDDKGKSPLDLVAPGSVGRTKTIEVLRQHGGQN
jgi:ankyrin repeat protein